MMRLNARQLRLQEPDPLLVKNLKRHPIFLILDNVLDTYNVGAIFRLADAVAAEKVFLCGETETPPNPKIKKASVSTWKWVNWEYSTTALDAINKLKIESALQQDLAGAKVKIIAVEQHEKSIPLAKFRPEFPLALVVGNETYGVSKEVLNTADAIVELPMYGINKSLNVMVTAGIVLYRIIEHLDI